MRQKEGEGIQTRKKKDYEIAMERTFDIDRQTETLTEGDRDFVLSIIVLP